MRLHCSCNASGSLAVTRVLRIFLLLAIILTGCAGNPTKPILTEYEGPAEGKKVFHDIAQKILDSNKRTVALIDFPNKNGQKIGEGKNAVKNMAVSLKKIIGRDKKKVWIESGKSLMNALEKRRIIKNGKIVNEELAKRFWQKKGIEIVIMGVLDPHINGIGFSIELHDVQGDKVIHQFKGYWLRDDTITSKGSQSSESTRTSPDAWRPQIPSAYHKISPDFFSHKPATLENVGEALEKALRSAGFNNSAYLLVPEGFAIVSSPKELKFSFDGTLIKGPISDNFFRLTKSLENSWWNRFRFFCLGKRPDFYEVVCVIVTSGRAYYEDEPKIKFETAKNLVINGKGTNFPKKLKNKKYNEDEHVCTVLLYAFKEDSLGDDTTGPSGKKIQFVSLNDTDNVNIRKRLEKTGFWK